MHANHRHYILFIVAFVTFVVTALGYAYMREKVYTQAVTAANIIKEVKQLQDEKKHEQEVASAYSQFADDKALISGYVLSPDDVVHFIEAVEKIGVDTSTGIELSGIETQDVVRNSTNAGQLLFPHIKAHAAGRGTWANSMRALSLIEHLPYAVSFDNIHISVDGTGSGSPDLQTGPVGTTTKSHANNWAISLDVRALGTPQ